MWGGLRLGALCLALLIVSCSGSDPPSPSSGGGGAGVAGHASGSSMDGGSPQATGTSGSGDFGNAGPLMPVSQSDASLPPADCVGTTQAGAPVEVDMYVMLDRSDSMQEVTGAGNSKWDAIRDALSSFVKDPQSAGLGVGLQYFPLGTAGVPEHCATDTDCTSAGGNCLNKVCQPSPLATTFTPTFCVSNADCSRASPGCALFGVCSGDPTYACFNIGAGNCDQQGDCVAQQGECSAFGSCMTSDYSTPAVDIGLLPDNAPALVDSLTGEHTIGLTPTGVALQGAIDRAGTHAMDNPTHRVVAVLATDGLPTDCLPANVQDVDQAVSAVAGIAAAGVALPASIHTYVIGVFSPDDPDAMTKLDQIAMAGGTDHAFIVDSSKDVTQQLLDALATIRGGILSCDFQLPAPPDGQKLDYGYINVEFKQGANTQKLYYVETPDQCDQADLGWYYDTDPKQGTPSKLSVCPATCDTLRAATNASVEIRLGCQTEAPF